MCSHLVYADDTVLLALQKLINICSDFAHSHSLIYYETKTKFMCIKPSILKTLYIPSITINSATVQVVAMERYLGGFFKKNM